MKEIAKMSSHELRKAIIKLENRLDKTTSNYDKAQATFNELQKLETELERRNNIRSGFSFR